MSDPNEKYPLLKDAPCKEHSQVWCRSICAVRDNCVLKKAIEPKIKE